MVKTGSTVLVKGNLLNDVGLDRPAKVGNLDLAAQTQQQVFRLNVTMDHPFVMEIVERMC